MADDDDDQVEESSPALRAKAARCLGVAKLMGGETRARLEKMANNCIERAIMLEQHKGER
jgi:hypothetical protein